MVSAVAGKIGVETGVERKTMKRVDTADASIAYADDGRGPAVLLLHGSFSADWFAPAAKLLVEDQYRALTMHRAGYGQSKDLVGGISMRAHAAHAAAVLEAAGVRRAHVVGHSSGASAALQLAHDRPDLVGSLVLLETAFPYAPDEPKSPAMPLAVATARAGDYDKAFDLFLAGVGGPHFRDVFVRELGENGLREAIGTSEYFFTTEAAAYAPWTFGPAELGRITIPVLLVVGGAGERLGTPHCARSAQLAAGLPHAQTRILAGLSHLMPLEDPKLIARTIGDFAAEHGL
jgi:pimeloyl-ACP methyl ester carboxylesterase